MSGVLALHDGKAGNARQALALARALDAHAGEHHLHPRAPWRWLAPRMPPGAAHAFHAMPPTPPAVAIGCGRQAALATRLLRARGSHAVQILDPRIDPRHWDLVIAPRHDGLDGDNVITTLGSLHPVDAAWLRRARDATPALAALPAPHTVVLVGGPTRHAPLDDAGFAALLQVVAMRTQQEGGSISVVASRRTPTPWRNAIAAITTALPGVRWRDERDGANPYAGLLAHAGRIVCTPDSVNMASEAAATGAPVFLWRPEATRGRLRLFVDALLAGGHARPLDAAMAPFATVPLHDTEHVAAQVRARLNR